MARWCRSETGARAVMRDVSRCAPVQRLRPCNIRLAPSRFGSRPLGSIFRLSLAVSPSRKPFKRLRHCMTQAIQWSCKSCTSLSREGVDAPVRRLPSFLKIRSCSSVDVILVPSVFCRKAPGFRRETPSCRRCRECSDRVEELRGDGPPMAVGERESVRRIRRDSIAGTAIAFRKGALLTENGTLRR